MSIREMILLMKQVGVPKDPAQAAIKKAIGKRGS